MESSLGMQNKVRPRFSRVGAGNWMQKMRLRRGSVIAIGVDSDMVGAEGDGGSEVGSAIQIAMV